MYGKCYPMPAKKATRLVVFLDGYGLKPPPVMITAEPSLAIKTQIRRGKERERERKKREEKKKRESRIH